MNVDDRHERLRALTAAAARGNGRLPEDEARRPPAAGDLYVLPQTADYPVEWALLERDSSRSGFWLAVPADTNPLRGPGDVWLGPGEPEGPLCLRCRFSAELSRIVLAEGRRTGALSADATARALATWRDLDRGDLEVDPLAEEVAVDPEYQGWERDVLGPARMAAVAAKTPSEGPGPAITPSSPRPLLALAAALGLLALGLGAWSWQLRERIDRLSDPLLIGGSQEIVVGTDMRAPATLEVRSTDERLLVFLVLSGEAGEYPRYRVELIDAENRVLWQSPEVERGPIPELNLMIPRRLLDRERPTLKLVLFGREGGHDRRLAEIPLRIERVGATTQSVD